ncbi:hypothetical protein GCM10023322_10750 [Rugosimonospora acidiphila]|uniref:Vitamin K epoxide reductase domain-containing protein n=1 Tax=Rugosimonospora acidiphila TaxID=556531 RepID=A0ABP9RLX8_9ACTN
MTEPEPLAPPRWPGLVTLPISVVGLAVAAFLTIQHYTTAIPLACPDTGIINCTKVTTSAQSAIFGIPVALLGLLFFAAMVPLCLPAAWRSTRPELRWGRLAFALIGVGFVVYLVYTELFTLDALCLWCTTVHVITVVLFAVVAMATASTGEANA